MANHLILKALIPNPGLLFKKRNFDIMYYSKFIIFFNKDATNCVHKVQLYANDFAM